MDTTMTLPMSQSNAHGRWRNADTLVRAVAGTLRTRVSALREARGYGEQYNDGMLDEAINSPGYKRLWSAARLKAYREKLQELKGNAQVCATTVGMGQNMLLADRSAMDHILEAIRKIKVHSAALAKKA